MVVEKAKKLPQITRKTLLYKSGVEYASYALNHAEGCSHGCRFPCYAMMLKKRCGVVNNYQDWIKPKIVSNALELLETEIPKLKHKIGYVFMCFTTDPFMYGIKEINDLSLKIIERLNKDKIKVVSVSKGLYPMALIDKEKYGKNNEYGSTIVSLSEAFRKTYEPGSSSYRTRIKVLKKLHDTGLKTWVSMEPYPTLNIVKQDINEILEEISFVDKIVFGKWNYNKFVSSYDGAKEFYNEMTEEVLNFCRKNNIEIHIKEGTTTPSNKYKISDQLFYEPRQKALFV